MYIGTFRLDFWGFGFGPKAFGGFCLVWGRMFSVMSLQGLVVFVVFPRCAFTT